MGNHLVYTVSTECICRFHADPMLEGGVAVAALSFDTNDGRSAASSRSAWMRDSQIATPCIPLSSPDFTVMTVVTRRISRHVSITASSVSLDVNTVYTINTKSLSNSPPTVQAVEDGATLVGRSLLHRGVAVASREGYLLAHRHHQQDHRVGR